MQNVIFVNVIKPFGNLINDSFALLKTKLIFFYKWGQSPVLAIIKDNRQILFTLVVEESMNLHDVRMFERGMPWSLFFYIILVILSGFNDFNGEELFIYDRFN